MVENVKFTEEKKEGAVDCAIENPSVFTPTVELTMFVYKIHEELSHRKELKKTTLHALNYLLQCTRHLHW